MKRLRICLACALPLCVAAAPADKTAANFLPRTGDWASVKAWSKNEVPRANTYAFVSRNNTASVKSAVPECHSVWLGGKNTSGTLILEDGAKMRVLSKIHVGQGNVENTKGIFLMRGGELYANSPDDIIGGLAVGVGKTYSGTGLATLSGGVFTGSIMIGSALANTHQGTLSVVGGALSVVGSKERERLWLHPHGTLVFYAGENGYATLDYSKSGAYLHEGSRLIVDGGGFTGKSRRFLLLKLGALKDDGCRLETRNFPPNLSAVLKWEKKKGTQLTLVLSEK